MIGSRPRNRRRIEERSWQWPTVDWRRVMQGAVGLAALTLLVLLLQHALDRPVTAVAVEGRFQRVSPLEVEQAVRDLAAEGAVAATSVADLCSKLTGPRHVWLMLPVAFVDATIAEVARNLSKGDCIIDGGNSHYIDDIRRAKLMNVGAIEALKSQLDPAKVAGETPTRSRVILIVGSQSDVYTP